MTRRRRSRRSKRARRIRVAVVFGRAAEELVSAAIAAVAGLAVLEGAVIGGRPWLMTAALVGVAVAGTGLAVFLDRVRRRAKGVWRYGLDLVAVAGLAGLVWWSPPGAALRSLGDLLAGERATQDRVLRHQVYAAYRRMDLAEERKILERAEAFVPAIERAARAFDLEADLLVGVAATESSLYPRDSRDGGRGLFQITAVPPAAAEAARRKLGVAQLDSWNQVHNAHLAAATLSAYREQMSGDIFLTLLAYNIGPQNGGLRTVMQRYGARNFAQVQPYLQTMPRDYPVRVLAAALAYRLWRRHRSLPRLEEAAGAPLVQAVGIPGLDDDASRATTGRPAG